MMMTEWIDIVIPLRQRRQISRNIDIASRDRQERLQQGVYNNQR